MDFALTYYLGVVLVALVILWVVIVLASRETDRDNREVREAQDAYVDRHEVYTQPIDPRKVGIAPRNAP